MIRTLIVDDEEDILLSLKVLLEPHFEKVQTESNPYQIPRHLRKEGYDLVLLDMNFKKGETSGEEGVKWLEKILELHPETSVVMFTAYADVKTAVNAVKIGAVDFIEKPFDAGYYTRLRTGIDSFGQFMYKALHGFL